MIHSNIWKYLTAYNQISSKWLLNYRLKNYIQCCGEMIFFGKSDKIIKISGKVDKPKNYNGFNCYIVLS